MPPESSALRAEPTWPAFYCLIRHITLAEKRAATLKR
ncbi:hypothetical protein BH11ARM1_BH11ARM1_11580 [soil metagenome]